MTLENLAVCLSTTFLGPLALLVKAEAGLLEGALSLSLRHTHTHLSLSLSFTPSLSLSRAHSSLFYFDNSLILILSSSLFPLSLSLFVSLVHSSPSPPSLFYLPISLSLPLSIFLSG